MEVFIKWKFPESKIKQIAVGFSLWLFFIGAKKLLAKACLV